MGVLGLEYLNKGLLMSIQRNLFSVDSKGSSHPQEITKRPKKKKTVNKSRTCEHMTDQRTKDLKQNGINCAKAAKSKGQTIEDSRGYIYLMGDNNTAAFMSGWNEEFNK